MTKFPYISDEHRKELLAPQPGQVRVVVDTDAANEVDDQFAITWGLLSPDRLDIEAIVAAPFSRAYFREPLLAAARANVDHSTAAEVDDIAAWGAPAESCRCPTPRMSSSRRPPRGWKCPSRRSAP